ncbi:Lag1 longevity assurance-like protein [Thalictrum thalictroides]|uniref:Lag1 longevity assurance-like protein n=1 Tax=Thalictrum thalictroides TaxID=46969 RepID=A0A7J6WXT0_THATH|nr:Lag1 longevity assurance-like protein [Thalictrum thalictroides]
MESIWSSTDAPDPWHFLIALYFVIFFFAARFFLDNFVFRKLAVWFSVGGSSVKIDEAKYAKITKCSESMWKLTYYATIEAFILTVGYYEYWFRDTDQYLRGWPNQELKLAVKLFYMCQCGFYIYSIAALLTWETRRKDFSIMMSHHIVTTFLISYSYITSFFRIGSVILALHDASDVFMEAAKVFKYSGKELAASVLFGCFAVSWVVLRLLFFPFCVIKTTSYDFIKILMASDDSNRSYYYVYNTMLITLLIFHIYWWILIFSMIRRQLKNKGQVGEDIRSDSDDD